MKVEQSPGRTLLALSAMSLAGLMALALVTLWSSKVRAAGSLSLVYIESNINSTNGNTVLGFSNDGSGNLTPLPGSPYSTGGTGVAPGSGSLQFDGDGQIIINPEGTLLFAVNGHSNNISVFTINSDGSLTPISGSPFSSGGQDPVSLAIKDNALGGGVSMLVALNKNSDPNQTGGTPNYTTFQVTSAGVMSQNANSTYNLAAGSSPGQVVTFRGQNKFFGIEFLNSTVSSYQLARTGKITQISTSTPPVSNPAPLGAVLHPKSPTLYVGLPMQSAIAAYTFNTPGVLTYVTNVANQGLAVCWLAMNSGGSRLYSAETESGSVSVYNTTAVRNPVQLQHVALQTDFGGLTPTPSNLGLDPTGAFLYVLDQRGTLHTLAVAVDGTLTEPNTPMSLGLPSGTIPVGLVTLSK